MFFALKKTIRRLTMKASLSLSSSVELDDGQGRQEEALQAHLFWPADFCTGKNLRADEVPRRPGESSPGLLARNDRKPSQSKNALNRTNQIIFFITV